MPALRAVDPTPGEYTASRPLEVVQIDHTQVDVIVVDEQSREPIGRPWITLAVDVLTRMVAGFHLGLDAPSRVSIGLCLLHAVYDKTAWTAERGIDAPWPVAGLPAALQADNGSDFHSRAFVRACRNQGIRVDLAAARHASFWRAHRTPDRHADGRGAFVPGTTFSNPAERGEYQLLECGAHDVARARTLDRLGDRRPLSPAHSWQPASPAHSRLARA